ncbi:hypothetical protein Tco_0914850, partial [Tanacetum coccineum]
SVMSSDSALSVAPLSLDYVLGPEHPPSPDYVLGLKYPEYLAPSDDDIPIKYQPLHADASLTTLLTGYIADSDPEEDLEDNHEEDPADYLDKDEAFEEEDDDEEEEHLAQTNSSTVSIDDHVPSTEETEPFETYESTPTPPPPRLRKARISVQPQTPMAAAIEALISAVDAALPSSSPPPSLLTSLSSPLPQIPSPPLPLPS